MTKKWTPIQRQCYDRNCVCEGCEVQTLISSSKKCLVKKSLIEQIRKYGIDERIQTKCVITEK